VGEQGEGVGAELVAGHVLFVVGGVFGEAVGEVVDDRVELESLSGPEPCGEAGGGGVSGTGLSVEQVAGPGPAEPDPGAGGVGLDAAAVGLEVGLDDRGLGEVEQSPGREPDRLTDGLVDERGGVTRQGAGHGGDLACDPHLHHQVVDLGEQQREPVSQVQSVGGEVAGGLDAGLAGDGELGEAELRDRRCALAAERDQLVAALGDRGRSRLGLGIGRVQVGPVQDQQQLVDAGLASGLEGVFDLGQGGCLVEVGVRARAHGLILLAIVFDTRL